MSGKSSGITSMASTSAPASSARWASSGPEASSAWRRATDVEMVRTAVRIARVRLALAAPGPAAPAGLLDERDGGDLDTALERLDHVVDGEGGDRRRGHRLHLHAGAGGDAGLRGERHRAGGGVDLGLEVDVV